MSQWRMLRTPNGYVFFHPRGRSSFRGWDDGWYPLAAEEFLKYLNSRGAP